MDDYRFVVRPLSDDEGGGYLVEFPDLPGCISDGETIEEAVANGQDAKASWIAAMTEAGRPVPPPTVEPRTLQRKMAIANAEIAASQAHRAGEARGREPQHAGGRPAGRRARRESGARRLRRLDRPRRCWRAGASDERAVPARLTMRPWCAAIAAKTPQARKRTLSSTPASRL
jgi:predicted RNase H-like HicB family nuclease